jgi:hypothetical protein
VQDRAGSHSDKAEQQRQENDERSWSQFFQNQPACSSDAAGSINRSEQHVESGGETKPARKQATDQFDTLKN